MSLHHEMQYNDTGGTYELVGTFLGLVAGIFFSNDITLFIQDTGNFLQLAQLLDKEPAIAKISCGAGGLLGGYYSGKIISIIPISFRRRSDDKKMRKELEEKGAWIKDAQRKKDKI